MVNPSLSPRHTNPPTCTLPGSSLSRREAASRAISSASISRLNFLLGELYAEAILETCRRKRVPVESIHTCGMHGQTIYHEGSPADYLGRPIASTLQIGESAVVAERTGLWVISNFRERDIAAGASPPCS